MDRKMCGCERTATWACSRVYGDSVWLEMDSIDRWEMISGNP